MARFNKVLCAYLIADVVFLVTAVLLAVVSFNWMRDMEAKPTLATVARYSLISETTLKGGVANAGLVVLTFLLSLPTLVLRTSVIWLRVQNVLVIACAMLTLILGLSVWVDTLTTTARLGHAWSLQAASTQSLLQTVFKCCGYLNSTSPAFQPDSVCTTAIVAAQRQGCSVPFSNYANSYLGMIFTASFGIVVVDIILFLCVAMLIRTRNEEIRYRHLDAKQGI